MQRMVWLTIGVVASMYASGVFAQQSTVDGIRTEQAIVVEGEQPGPGLWLVRKGDHDLYLLGTLSPLPMKMHWQSKQVHHVLSRASEVIYAPRVSLEVKAGFFKKLSLLPQLMGARNNPNGKRLQDLVSPATYARWQVLKARYIGHDAGVERMRPVFASQELYGEAMKKAGLDRKSIATPVIAEAIKKYQPAVTRPTEIVVIADPKTVLREWKNTSLDDVACFDKTMNVIENELDAMRALANAWATGDVQALRTLPQAALWETCVNSMTEAGIGRRLGFADAQRHAEEKWFLAVEKALSSNAVSFAMLPVTEMLKPNGYLAKLEAKGYTVIAPDE